MSTVPKQPLWYKILPLSLTLIVVALDQISKALVVTHIPQLTLFSDNAVVPVIGNYVQFIHVRNPAVAFSLGSGLSANARHVLFAVVPLVVIIVILRIYFRNNEFSLFQRWSICGILGGGIGNLIDRFFRPAGVVDFIDCYFFGLFGLERWPTFNIADMAVVICGILCIMSFGLQIIHDSASKKEGQTS